MRRRSQGAVHAIQLVTGGAAQHEAVGADHGVAGDPGEDEGSLGCVSLCGGAERQRPREAHTRAPDAHELLWRSPTLAPEAAELARGRMVVLTRRVPPGSPAPSATDLDHVRPLGIDGRHPVEAVAAEVDEASPAFR